MKYKKIISIMLAASVISLAAGCSNYRTVTHDDFMETCDQLGAQEVEIENYDFTAEDFEDGLLISFDEDDIEEYGYYFRMVLSMSKIGLGIDVDDIENISIYGRVDPGVSYWKGFFSDDFDFEEVDFSDYESDGVVALQITLSEEYEVDDLMDGIDDLFAQIGIDTDDLSKKEWNYNNDNGYLRLHVDISELTEAFLESDAFEIIQELDEDRDYEEMIEGRTGDIGIEFEVSPNNVFVLLGVNVNHEPDRLNELCDSLRLSNPLNLPSNGDAVESVINSVDRYAGIFDRTMNSYLDRAREAAEEFEEEQMLNGF
ncbi:MAG: hypothetical protein K6F79_06715 [Saccharofermentans sp.]|nr:hypothetical protein [Saccharofermentans sp.]